MHSQVMKEVFLEKRDLINKITRAQLEKVVLLLDEIKDPRYIDFLMSICTCNSEPMPRVQQYITELLLINNKHHLPQLRIENGTLHMLILDKGDNQLKADWMDVSTFKKQMERAGKWRDYAFEIMSKPFASLQPQEKKFRYFVRCTNLFGKLALGRNQMALRSLLFNETLHLSYGNILCMMKSESLPLLVRARFTTLMQILYVDRNPNYERPFIVYTRAWSKYHKDDGLEVKAEAGAETPGGSDDLQPLPVCVNGFVDLREFLLQDIKQFGGTQGRNEQGLPAITETYITMGQIEYMTAQVRVCKDMLRFSLLTTNRNSVYADLSNAKRLFDALFAIIQISDPNTVMISSKEGLALMGLRALVLTTIIILCDIRANFRISLALHTFETLFEKMQQHRSQLGRSLYKRADSQISMSMGSSASSGDNFTKEGMVRIMFQPYESLLVELSKSCFSSSIVCPDHIGADKVQESYEGNVVIECLLGLTQYGDRAMNESIIGLIVRQASQHVRFMNDLSQVALLVFPDSVKVFTLTQDSIRLFSGIQNRLSMDKPEAYDEASSRLKDMQSFLLVSSTNSEASVILNQKIMIDLHFHVVLTTILRLPLERISKQGDDESPGQIKTVEPDITVNSPRRMLFQDVLGEIVVSVQISLVSSCFYIHHAISYHYDMCALQNADRMCAYTCMCVCVRVCFTNARVSDLMGLLVNKNKRAQRKISHVVPMILEHVGIQDLNVVGCVREILEGNLRACSEVSEGLIRRLMCANIVYGRRARWLNIIEIFLGEI